MQVAYSVLEPWPDEGEGCHPKMQVQPSVVLGTIPLVPAKGAYKEFKLTDAIMMLVPHPPLFPMSRMHIPVFIDRQKAKLLTAIVIRYVNFIRCTSDWKLFYQIVLLAQDDDLNPS